MANGQSRFARFAFIYALLVVTPVLFSLLLCLHIIDHYSHFWQEKAAEVTETKASELVRQLDSEQIFLPHFRDLTEKILSLPKLDEKKIVELAEDTFARISQRFFVYVFDTRGKMLKTGLAPEDTEAGIDYLWRFAHDDSYEGEGRERRGDYGKLVGRYFSPRNIKHSNDVCHSVENPKSTGLLYHKKRQAYSDDKSGVMYFLDLNIEFEHHLQQKINHYSSADEPVFFERANGTWQGASDVEALAQTVAKLGYTRTKNVVVHNDFLWRRVGFRDFQLYFGKKLSLDYYSRAKGLVVLFSVLLLALSFVYLLRNLFSGQGLRLSIRYKLIAIFVFAVYLPILGLVMVSFNGLNDRRTVLENDARKGMQDILYKIDADFAGKEDEILATFERLYNDRDWQDQITDDWLHNDQLLRKHARIALEGENFFNHLDIRNIRLEQVHSTARGIANDRIKEINRIISLICLERFMPEQMSKNQVKLRQSDFILKNMMENPVLGFSSFYEQPGRLVEMEFEGSSFYWYWNYYPDAGNSVAFFSGNTRVHFNVESFLNKVLQKRYNLGNTALHLAAYFPAQQAWTPESAGSENDLVKLVKLTEISKTLETGRINYEGKKFLATSLPGIKLKGAIISCLFPQSQIDGIIAGQRIQIFQGMALILIISVFTGLLLSKYFLQPVGELNLGMKALRQRNTDFRVEIGSQDELGELGDTFNQMMVEVKEMLLAGAVQQCLIPEKFPDIAGYDCIIYNKMATDVGGDYADVFSLGDDRYLVVLGDVTGHGVSSSILTAMVKAQVFRFARKNRSLSEILKSLSEMIFELLRYRKLMTFCALIFDARNHSCQFANAGHPFPIWCDADGKIKALDKEALPLGVSPRRSNYITVESSFEAGDMMLLYTDGIAEGAGPDGEAFGFDRVRELIVSNRSHSSEEVKNTLLSEFWQHYQREELDDDLTFVIIRRRRQDV
ncbi:MAG: SpoIIE family protein phosphatase [Candidatus Riflebacteria bacterium]|nr:SpoIIE family protein phosphatase [Candidatus Riflebacteria bacterium]